VSRRRGVHPGAVLAVAALAVVLGTPQGRAVLTSDSGPARARPPAAAKATEPGVTCAMLPAGIRHQESGGNRLAVSSLGAIGPDQIMPANVGPWSEEALGRPVSVAEFRRSPELQDQIGRYKIAKYCAAYGVRGAAAAWYSGNPARHRDYRPIANRSGPPVGTYVDSVMALARRYG
jgi:transglycosylase-like protein with SLT domain